MFQVFLAYDEMWRNTHLQLDEMESYFLLFATLVVVQHRWHVDFDTVDAINVENEDFSNMEGVHIRNIRDTQCNRPRPRNLFMHLIQKWIVKLFITD